jgi:hypothetical protein
MAALPAPDAQTDSPTLAFARWLAEDKRRENLPLGEAWAACFGGSVPTPQLSAPSKGRAPVPTPARRQAITPASVPAYTPRPPVTSHAPRLPEPARRVVPERAHPVVSRYERHRLVEVFAFEQPSEYVIRCTFHKQARHAWTFEAALDIFIDWRCSVCHSLGMH